MGERDAGLVQRVLEGDRAAFEALMAGHLQRAQALAGAVVGDPDAVEDIVQESFLRAYRKLGTLSEPAAFPGWLARIVHNEAVSWLRRTRRRPTIPLDHLDLGTADPDPDAERDRERMRRLEFALAELRPAYREIIALKYEARLSYEEIGETLGLSVPNVEKRLYRARQRLLELLGPTLDE